jgi:hypothetical protein
MEEIPCCNPLKKDLGTYWCTKWGLSSPKSPSNSLAKKFTMGLCIETDSNKFVGLDHHIATSEADQQLAINVVM